MTNEKKQIQWDRNEQEEAAVIEQTGIYKEKANGFFYEREWLRIKKNVDAETFALLEAWCEEHKDYKGLPFPIITLCSVGGNNTKFVRKYNRHLYKSYYDCKQRATDKDRIGYAELYRILAFAFYGYGNWSNSDRRRKGLAPIRKG
ncbi:hypothetical protein_gp233 [Bacillus phage vB_BceM_WH1]|nr:hypothetical protein_gp233 [Bacillus phage vB_BceM_WH1]